MSESLHLFLLEAKDRVDAVLLDVLQQQTSLYASLAKPQSQLTEACIYSVRNGGKRLRPALVYAVVRAAGLPLSASVDLFAAAIECIHSYSLVHDDLPAMDDDDLRRGQPTCHIRYDEATAILVGDGLQALAFELLANADYVADTKIQAIRNLAQAAGNQGMVGGQMLDLQSTGQKISLEQLQQLHALKTGALIRAAVGLGALAAGLDAAQQRDLDEYAQAVGLAFQVQDDILDIESDTETLGKTQGADQKLNKATYPALMGLAEAKAFAASLIERAHMALEHSGLQAELLHELADYVIQRSH